MIRSRALALAFLASGACADAPPEPTWGRVGPHLELGLLEGFNHASEVAIAAVGPHVVAAGMNLELASADGFEVGDQIRRVAIWTSHDGGVSYSGPGDLGTSYQTADPVVRAGEDGRFWLAVLNSETGDVVLGSSADDGDSWTLLAEDVPGYDKPWLAVDDAGSSLYTCGYDAVARVDFDGVLLATAPTTDANCLSAYLDGAGFHYLTITSRVERWDGISPPAVEVPARGHGSDANLFTQAAGSIGSSDALQWIVRARKEPTAAPVILELVSGSGEIVERTLTEPGATAFLPAATLDDRGRLHVVWYDSSGSRGVLRYTRSVGADLEGDFLPPITVDQDACPGRGWYPYLSSQTPPGGRRLREYIDIAVAGDRAHIAWTHAPGPPARIRATYVEPGEDPDP